MSQCVEKMNKNKDIMDIGECDIGQDRITIGHNGSQLMSQSLPGARLHVAGQAGPTPDRT